MDTITHALLGATIGEAGFRGRLGWKAVAFGAACAAAPDLDVVAAVLDEWSVLQYHRAATHALPMLPVMALALGWLGWRWGGRQQGLGCWVQLAGWALFSHLLNDWCTSYGTMLCWPFSDRRFALDAVSVLDPVYSGCLLLALLCGWIWWRRPAVRRSAAIGGLVLTTAYLGLGYCQSWRAQGWAEEALADRGFEARKVRAMPTLLNIWVWRLVAQDARGDLRVGFVSTWSPRPIEFLAYSWPADPLVEAARVSPEGRLFEWFSDGLLSARVYRVGEGQVVEFSDQRIGLISAPGSSPFRTEAVFDSSGQLRSVHRVRSELERGRLVRTEWVATWSLLHGGPLPRSGL